MTSYHIEVGYNSSHGKDEAGKRLLKVVAELQAEPTRISQEVHRLRPDLTAAQLSPFIESYRAPISDLTLYINTTDEGLPRVNQVASSGNGPRSRELKEECRRAFCRLVIEAMHREGMEVNLSVC